MYVRHVSWQLRPPLAERSHTWVLASVPAIGLGRRGSYAARDGRHSQAGGHCRGGLPRSPRQARPSPPSPAPSNAAALPRAPPALVLRAVHFPLSLRLPSATWHSCAAGWLAWLLVSLIWHLSPRGPAAPWMPEHAPPPPRNGRLLLDADARANEQIAPAHAGRMPRRRLASARRSRACLTSTGLTAPACRTTPCTAPAARCVCCLLGI